MAMDAETQKRWDRWAANIARNESRRMTKLILDAGKEGLFKITDPMAARIAALENEVKALKERQPAPAEEWPLRSVEGGKR